MYTELASWTKEICKMDFFQHSIGLTVAQLRREANLEVLLQSMLLLDARHEGYDEWKSISTAEVTKYCKHIRGKYNDDKKLMIMEIIEYLSNAFKEKHKFLKKSNIPMIIVLGKLALENNIEPEKFKSFVDSFSNTVCVDYEANTGSGNVKRQKTEGRLLAIANAFADYFNLENVNILSTQGGTKNGHSPEEDTQNSDINSSDGSVDYSDEDNLKNSDEVTENETTSDEELVVNSENSTDGEKNDRRDD